MTSEEALRDSESLEKGYGGAGWLPDQGQDGRLFQMEAGPGTLASLEPCLRAAS